jgi:hypothetical protein
MRDAAPGRDVRKADAKTHRKSLVWNKIPISRPQKCIKTKLDIENRWAMLYNTL